MSLKVAREKLEKDIRQAVQDSANRGTQEGTNPEDNISAFAKMLAAAIHEYVSSADVDITQVVSTIAAGISVSTTFTSGSLTASGATSSSASAKHEGFGSLS
jgi:hypothetical protein